MTENTRAVAALMRRGAEDAAHLAWQRADDSTIEFDVDSPYSVRLAAVSGVWRLETLSGRGGRTATLGRVESSFDEVMSALFQQLYVVATDEFDDSERSGSQAMAQVLRTSADEQRDALWCARAATLLAGHAIKDGYGLQARLRLEEAAALYDAAGDSDSLGRMRATLSSLPELLRA